MAGTMEGKTILVTGSTDGIGMQTALELARLGARILIHGRNKARADAALKEIRSKTGNESLAAYSGDFSSLAQTRGMAEEIAAKEPRLDVLLNNAGVYMTKRQMTADGLETTFQVNHLAVFLVTGLLLDLLKRSAPSRVVVVSSMTHAGADLDFANLQGEGSFDGYEAYARSKLCNVLFVAELAERLRGSGVTVNSLQPGVIGTKLLRNGFGMSGDSLEAGARTPLYLASSPEVGGVTGKYFSNRKEATPSGLTRDTAIRKRLWDVSERLCGLG